MLKQMQQSVEEAELVLVGLGEEMGLSERTLMEKCHNIPFQQIESEQLLGYLVRQGFSQYDACEYQRAYQVLYDMIKDKNYFLISVNTDGFAKRVPFREERQVYPCGGYSKLQCPNGCEELLTDPLEVLDTWAKDFLLAPSKMPDELSEAVCPKCGRKLVFNNIYAENYQEAGYLDQWSVYTKWLQGTVNRKVCMIELGVGMRFPSVIRWPFEKIMTYNKKATFYRVHSLLSQFPDTIQGNAIAVAKNPVEFLNQK